MAAKGNSAPASPLKGPSSAKIVVEYLPVDALVPYAKNAKSHPPKQIAQIAASLKEFGFIVPVLVDKDNVLVAGHGRILGAKEAGIASAPTIRIEHLTEAQVRGFRIADNKLNLNSDLLDDILSEELGALEALDFDLTLLGFDERELDKLLQDDAELARAEETPPVPEVPVTLKGDCWLLGKHRIVCGDSTVATDVDKALNGVKPHLMVTDPPYGVNYDATWRGKAGHATMGKNRTGKVEADDKADWREVWTLFPGNIAYVWHGGLHAGTVADSLIAAGFTLRAQIIWNKSVMAMSRGDYHWKHEPCWYAVKGTGNWTGDRKQTTVWDLKSPIHIMGGSDEVKTDHPTQKPVDCMRRPILNNSSAGQAIFEPFSGSGSTLIACEMTERCCHALELSEAYTDVAVLRWQTFAGGQATLEGDGRTFDEIKAERHGKDAD